MSKKIVSLILAISFCLMAVVTAYAATPSIAVSNVEAERGKEITVVVSLADNPGIVAMKLLVKYDTNVLEYQSSTISKDFSGITGATAVTTENNGDIILNWIVLSTENKNCTANGTFAEIKFKVKDNAAKGDSVISVTYDEDDVYNVKEENISFATNNGKVTVKAPCEHTNTELRNKKDATCKEEGYSGDTYCLDCNTTISTGRQLPKDANNHVGGTEVKNEKKATCKEEGYIGDTCCKGCGAVITKGKSIAKDADNHTGNTEIRNKQEANCVDKGNTGDTYCKDCNKLIKAGEVSDPNKDNHKDLKVINKKDATCKEEGYTGDTHCEACGYTAQGEVIPKTENHKFGAWKVTKEPTNTEEGEKERTCSVCGKVETAKIAKVSSDSDPIHVNVNGNANKDEINPNTGAEAVCGVVVAAAVVSGALWIASRKRH